MDQNDQQPGNTAGNEAPEIEVKWRKKNASRSAEPAAQQAGAQSEDLDSLRAELGQAQGRIRELQDRWQRAAADLVNLRRRTEEERSDMEKFASMMMVAEMLPVLDNFERALATIPGNLQMLTWIQGIMLIERHLRSILERQGLVPIEATNQPFNPHLHEAISERPTGEATPGTVLQEYQRGYTMHGRVIRPTLVEVAAPLSPSPAPEETTAEEGEEIAEQSENENTGP